MGGGVGRGGAEWIGDGHDLDDGAQRVEFRCQRGQVLGVDDEHLRSGVVADVADLVRGQSGVDGHEDRACQRHPEVGHQHLRDVRAHVGHPVTGLHAGRAQRVRQPGRLGAEFAVAHPAVAVRDRRLVGEHVRRTLEERQGGQRGKRVGWHVSYLHYSVTCFPDSRCCSWQPGTQPVTVKIGQVGHEGAGGVPGHAGVVVLGQPAHQGDVGVGEIRCQVEVVVVDDHLHLLADGGQSLLDLGADRLDVV